MNKREAAAHWVHEMNAIPMSVVEKLMTADGFESVVEITPHEDDDEYWESRDYLPMWGTMWSFSEMLDNWWLEECGGLQKMADCGFRIYEQEDYGYIFGIDGAGYDFYEAHWIPLYEARGLKWHDDD